MLRENSQSVHMGQPECIMFIIEEFKPLILLHCGRVGQMHRITAIGETLHNPIPVKGGLNCDVDNFSSERLQFSQDNICLVW